MGVDLTKLSDADLQAVAAGDMSKVSDEGLTQISGQPSQPEQPQSSWDQLVKAVGSVGDYAKQGFNSYQQGLSELPGHALHAVKGANGAIVSALGMIPDAAISASNLLTGQHDPTFSDKWQEYSDQTIPPANNLLDKALEIGGGFAAGAKIPLPGGKAPPPSGQLADTFARARNAGYVVTPSSINPSVFNRTAETLAGGKEFATEATQKNARKALENLSSQFNLPAGTEITHSTMDAVRNDANKGYDAVARLGPAYQQLVDIIKNARSEASGLYRKSAANYDPQVVKDADEAWQKAQNADAILAGAVKQAGQPELFDNYLTSRRIIAQTHDVDKAIIDSRAEVTPNTFIQAFGKEKPQSGAIYDLGRSGQAFGPSFTTKPGVGGAFGLMDKVLLGSGAGLYELAHKPQWAAATIGAAVARHAARKALLSGPVQDMMLMSPQQKQQALAEALLRGTVASQGNQE